MIYFSKQIKFSNFLYLSIIKNIVVIPIKESKENDTTIGPNSN